VVEYRFGVISADSHLTITNDKLLTHVPAAYHDVAKRFLAEHTGNPIGSSGTHQASEDEHFWPAMGRVGQYDPVERMKDMDIDGIDVEFLYTQGDAYMMPAGDPPALDGMALLGFPDDEGRLPMIRAYNDALAEWIDVGAGRLNPMGIVPITPLDDGVAEVRRLADLGFRGIRIQALPPAGDRPFWDEKWNPLWEAAIETNQPVHLHLGAGFDALAGLEDPLPGRPLYKSLPPIMMSTVLGSFLLYGPAKTFPELKIGFVEAGVGWIPYYLERLDTMWRRHSYRDRHATSEPPSTYWHRNCFGTFEDDKAGVRCLDLIGPTTVMWASDYPHPDSTYPESRRVIEDHFSKITPEQKHLVTFENARRIYNLPKP
jgi:predicted TIM-barrel fold metal-dependent hydrolase